MLKLLSILAVSILALLPIKASAQDFDFLVATYLLAGVTDDGQAYAGKAQISKVDGGSGYAMTRCINGNKEIVAVKKDKFVLGGDGPIVAYLAETKEADFKYRVFVDLNNYATLMGYGGEQAHEHLVHREMDEFTCETGNNKDEE